MRGRRVLALLLVGDYWNDYKYDLPTKTISDY